MSKLVIIGNGISGITVARHVRKMSDMEILIISSESKHFYSRTALMYIYMGHMNYEHTKPYEDFFWEKNRIQLKQAFVKSIDSDKKELHLSSNDTLSYDKLVIATGSKPNKFGWPGQDLDGVQGLYSLQDLELMESNTKSIRSAVIVGGGLIGIEMAEMLLSREIDVKFLIREPFYWSNILPEGEAKLVTRHAEKHGVQFKLETELKEIKSDSNGRVTSVLSNHNEEIPCQFVGLTAGVSPNVDFVRSSNINVGRGVLVNDYLETNIEDVYACGDCAEILSPEGERNRIEALWYTGRIQAKALAKTICSQRSIYERGIWFNSAKFFDIEYQTYGFVPNMPAEGSSSFYWEAPDGEHCIHIVYNTKDHIVTGINSFGIRMRHSVWEKWLSDHRELNYVLSHLKDANFDPELYKSYEADIIAQFNQENPKDRIELKARKWFTKRILQDA